MAAATGGMVFTCPPFTADGFEPKWLEGYDVLYFRLHGLPGGGTWFGTDGTPALRVGQVEAANLRGAGVVVANCYGTTDPLAASLYRAGAEWVVGGAGMNVAAGNRVVGTDLLMQWLLRGLYAGLDISDALRLAQIRLAFTAWRHADRDAMQFYILPRGEKEKDE